MGLVDRPNKYPLLIMGTSSGQRLKSSVAGSWQWHNSGLQMQVMAKRKKPSKTPLILQSFYADKG